MKEDLKGEALRWLTQAEDDPEEVERALASCKKILELVRRKITGE
ncbi:MAG TPA: hypothetical protein ACFYD5_03400 [Candidatus Tripitaka sp. YC43]